MASGRESNPMFLIEKYNDKSYITKEEASHIVRNRVHERTKEGMWIRFEESDNSADAEALTKISKLVEKTGMKNPWCTGGGMATTYLPKGDFYIFVDNEYNPQVTIRYEGDRIAEIRGTKDNQELTKTQSDTVGEFLPKIPNGPDYMDQIKATNTLYLMREGRDFQTKEELVDYLDSLSVEIDTYNYSTKTEHDELKNKYLDRAIAANDKFKVVGRIIKNITENTALKKGDLVVYDSVIKKNNLPESGSIEEVKFLGKITFDIDPDTKYSIGKNNEFNGDVIFEWDTLPEGFKIESGTTFNGVVNFRGATLPEGFKIESGVTFNRDVNFSEATLPKGFKIESGVTFNREVNFSEATLPEGFKIESGTTFNKDVSFIKTTLPEGFKIESGVTFNRDVNFSEATLPKGFKIESGVTFNGFVSFIEATLPKGFKIESGVTFNGFVSFIEATLPEGFKIEPGTTFNGFVSFRKTTLPEGFKIESEVTFNVLVSFEGSTLPEGFKIESDVTFNKNVSFYESTLQEGFKIESGTTFNGNVNFSEATLPEGFIVKSKDEYTIEITYPNGEIIEYKTNQNYLELNQDNRGVIIKTPTKTLTLLDKNNADVTTPIHELAHEYERGLTSEEIKVIEEWSGHKHGTTEFSESFAKGAELYIFEGTTFEGKVDNIFQKLYEWFKNVIKDAIEYFGDINQLNEAIRDVYDKMFMDGNIETESQQINNTVSEIINQLNKTFPDTKVHQLNSEQLDSKLKEFGVSEEDRKQVIAWHGTVKNIEDNRLSVDNSKNLGELLTGLYFGERRVSQSFAGITPFGDIQETSKIFKVKIDDSTFPVIDMRGESPTTDEALQKILSQKEYKDLLDKKRRGEIKGIRFINAVEHLYGESSSPTQYVVFDESVIENIKVYEGGLLRSIIDPLFQKGIEVTVNGFVHNGEVYLNTDNLNPETPIHEFAHIYNSWLKDNRPYTYQRGIELINEELTKENSEIKSVIDYVKETQPNLKGESLSEEILAQLIGERGVELINRNKKGGIVEWIKNVWNEIKNLLGLTDLSTEQVANLSIQDFAEMAATDLLKGERLTSEMERIKERAIADGTFMKAPNGKDTNLNERQWLQVRTEAFIAWFGDWINDPQNASKVVDENGEPLVVYHGTAYQAEDFISNWTGEEVLEKAEKPFYEFKETRSGFYFFADNIVAAESWASIRRTYSRTTKRIIPAFLNIRTLNSKNFNGGLITDEYIESFQKVKEDNITMINVIDDMYGEAKNISNVFSVKNPNQIKSATDNVGTFSSESNDIRYQVTGEQNAGLTPNRDVQVYITPDRKSTRLNSSHVAITY